MIKISLDIRDLGKDVELHQVWDRLGRVEVNEMSPTSIVMTEDQLRKLGSEGFDSDKFVRSVKEGGKFYQMEVLIHD